MDAKEASRRAKQYVSQVYIDETIADVGLEEVEFDEPANLWRVTIGFSRPWNTKNTVAIALDRGRFERSYKVVCIDDEGNVMSLKDRLLPAPTGSEFQTYMVM